MSWWGNPHRDSYEARQLTWLQSVTVRGSALHDVADVHAFVSGIVDHVVKARGAYLRPDKRDEAIDALTLVAVELAHRYRPGESPSFEAYAGYVLRRRVIDWWRKELGDSRAKTPRPKSESLEELLDSDGGAFASDSFEGEVVARAVLAA